MGFLGRVLLALLVLAGAFLTLQKAALACSWDYLIWIPRIPTADPLYRFIQNDKAGYIDQLGKVVIPPELPWWGNHGGEFHDGLLGDDEGIYINTNGKKVIDRGMYQGWQFSEGLAVATEEGRSKVWGYINTQGQFTIIPKFRGELTDAVWPFENGLAKVQMNGLFGFIDHSGNFVIEPQFLDADSFHDDMARVIVEGPCFYFRISEESPCPNFGVVPKRSPYTAGLPNCKYTFIDRSGRIVPTRRFDYIRHYSEGLAPFRDSDKWGYINKEGENAIAPRFQTAAPFADGLAMVSEGGVYGYIDNTGSYVIPPQFKYAEDFSGDRAVVGDHGFKYWYIGHDGRQAFPGTFEFASPFFKGLAHVKLLKALKSADENLLSETGKYAYVDRTGKVVFTYEH